MVWVWFDSDLSSKLVGQVANGLDGQGQARAAKVYAVVNLSHEFLDGTRVLVAGTPINSREGRTWAG